MSKDKFCLELGCEIFITYGGYPGEIYSREQALNDIC